MPNHKPARPWLKRVPELGEEATFLRKWGLTGILIGIGAGLGALALTWLISIVTQFVLTPLVDYAPPLPGGEGGAAHYTYLRQHMGNKCQ